MKHILGNCLPFSLKDSLQAFHAPVFFFRRQLGLQNASYADADRVQIRWMWRPILSRNHPWNRCSKKCLCLEGFGATVPSPVGMSTALDANCLFAHGDNSACWALFFGSHSLFQIIVALQLDRELLLIRKYVVSNAFKDRVRSSLAMVGASVQNWIVVLGRPCWSLLAGQIICAFLPAEFRCGCDEFICITKLAVNQWQKNIETSNSRNLAHLCGHRPPSTATNYKTSRAPRSNNNSKLNTKKSCTTST